MALGELNQRMDALVQDLSTALEETSSGRRQRTFGRRRARSTGNLRKYFKDNITFKVITSSRLYFLM
jgi:hypothetical protein